MTARPTLPTTATFATPAPNPKNAHDRIFGGTIRTHFGGLVRVPGVT